MAQADINETKRSFKCDEYFLIRKISSKDLKKLDKAICPYEFYNIRGGWSPNPYTAQTWKSLKSAYEAKVTQEYILSLASINCEPDEEQNLFIAKFDFVISDIITEEQEYEIFESIKSKDKKNTIERRLKEKKVFYCPRGRKLDEN